MTYQISEKAGVENPCVSFARQLGIKVLKVNPLWSAGWQDRIFFIPGKKNSRGVRTNASPLIIEFKRPGGDTSPLQEQRHKELLAAGYDHHVCDDKKEGMALIRKRLEAAGVYAQSYEVGATTPVRRPAPRPRPKKD